MNILVNLESILVISAIVLLIVLYLGTSVWYWLSRQVCWWMTRNVPPTVWDEWVRTGDDRHWRIYEVSPETIRVYLVDGRHKFPREYTPSEWKTFVANNRLTRAKGNSHE